MMEARECFNHCGSFFKAINREVMNLSVQICFNAEVIKAKFDFEQTLKIERLCWDCEQTNCFCLLWI